MGSTQQPVVAVATEQPSEFPCDMVVVDGEILTRSGSSPADCTDATLEPLDCVVLLGGDAVLALDFAGMGLGLARLVVVTSTGGAKPFAGKGIRLATL